MHAPDSPPPPFDPEWLAGLGTACAGLGRAGPRFLDLYLERRLEVVITVVGSGLQLEESRTEGVAARWDLGSRIALDAVTGASPASVQALLARSNGRPHTPSRRPLPAPEIDPPRGWVEWARRLASLLGRHGTSVRFAARRAVVVKAGEWHAVESPALVRVQLSGRRPSALLAVWGHRGLGGWLRELAEPLAARAWRPPSDLEVPVVLTSGTGGVLLHELVGHMAEADLVAAGGSPLAGLDGATIGPPGLEIVDDPTRADLPGAFTCDDEGVAAEPRPLVRAGALVGWLCDRLGAVRLGASPGRGRRARWCEQPVARMSNLVVAAGETPAATLEQELERGLVVTRLGGAAIDPLSGHTLIRVERGWELRHGRRRRPLAPFALVGSALEILATLDPRLGDDPSPDWRLGWCVKDALPLPTGAECPTLLARSLRVL